MSAFKPFPRITQGMKKDGICVTVEKVRPAPVGEKVLDAINPNDPDGCIAAENPHVPLKPEKVQKIRFKIKKVTKGTTPIRTE